MDDLLKEINMTPVIQKTKYSDFLLFFILKVH